MWRLSPKLVVVKVLNAMVECGDARTEPPSFGFVVAIVAGGWPPHVP